MLSLWRNYFLAIGAIALAIYLGFEALFSWLDRRAREHAKQLEAKHYAELFETLRHMQAQGERRLQRLK